MSTTDCYRQALVAATQALAETSESAQVDATSLLCHVLNCNSAHLAAWPEKQLSAELAQHYRELIAQRLTGMPVAYLTGRREFWSLELEVTPATLIPRPETETLVEFVLEQFADKAQLQLADLGTGSGAIAIAIASERPHWSLTATDFSPDALAVARTNAGRHGLQNISFILSNWFEALADKYFDVIISNPPYVAAGDPHLLQGDIVHEPVTALASGPQGMDDIERLVRSAPHHLNSNGWLVLEHGYDQKKQILDCFSTAEFEPVIQKNDLAGQARLTAGCFVQGSSA